MAQHYKGRFLAVIVSAPCERRAECGTHSVKVLHEKTKLGCATRPILWIPLLVITFIVVSIAVMVIAPPRLRVLTSSDLATTKIEPWRRNLRFFLILWFALTFYLVTYGFVIGWCAYLLGHSLQDVREATDMFSMPLAFVNSAFVIRPTSSLAAVFGIVFANCFFYAAVLLAIVRIVQKRLHQPVTQIGIFHPRQDQQDDEEL